MASCKTAVSPGHNTLWILQSCAKPSYSISFQFKVAFMWFRIQNHHPNSKQRATNNWPLNVIIIKHVLWCLLKKDLLEIYLNYLKDLVFCTTRSPSETFRGMGLWCFPCTCCLTGLNCNNVTNGSAVSASLQQCNKWLSYLQQCNKWLIYLQQCNKWLCYEINKSVCRHGFSNLVSNEWHSDTLYWWVSARKTQLATPLVTQLHW